MKNLNVAGSFPISTPAIAATTSPPSRIKGDATEIGAPERKAAATINLPEVLRVTLTHISQTAINTYLARLRANVSMPKIEPQPTGGRPACVYSLVINGHEVPVRGGGGVGHAFKTTLSAGDRHT